MFILEKNNIAERLMQSEIRFARAQLQKAARPAANNNKKLFISVRIEFSERLLSDTSGVSIRQNVTIDK